MWQVLPPALVLPAHSLQVVVEVKQLVPSAFVKLRENELRASKRNRSYAGTSPDVPPQRHSLLPPPGMVVVVLAEEWLRNWA